MTTRRNKRGTDPRDVPNYQLAEAASLLATPQNTLRNWMVGTRQMQHVLTPASRAPLVLSFWNVVECSVLKVMRRVHKVSLGNIRTALDHVRAKMGKERPLIEEKFEAAGKHLFVERFGKLVCVSQRGQVVIRQLLEASLRRIEWDEKGLALRLSPWHANPDEPRILVLDPRVAFGRAVLADTSTPALPILQRYQAGENMASLAEDFGVERERIEDLVRFFVPTEAA